MATLGRQFAKNFRGIRDFCGFTRDQFCEVLDIRHSTLVALEKADHSPSLEFLERLAARMKIQAWELLRFDPDFSLDLRKRVCRNLREIKA